MKFAHSAGNSETLAGQTPGYDGFLSSGLLSSGGLVSSPFIAVLKLRIPSPRPFATSGIFLPPNSSTKTAMMTSSSMGPIDLMRTPYVTDTPIVGANATARQGVLQEHHGGTKSRLGSSGYGDGADRRLRMAAVSRSERVRRLRRDEPSDRV